MYISKQWLNELVNVSAYSGQEVADDMSTTGIEIESVTNIGKGLKKLVVGETLDVIDHPDSDHLHICQVLVGQEHAQDTNGVLQIVCGAPNVSTGQKVIVALPGARIANNIKIKKGKIRGVVSNGMLCSLEELGFSSHVIPKEVEDGIYILPSDAVIGSDIVDYLALDDDLLELSITPNRSDALSMYGTAYEVGAIYNEDPIFDTTTQIVDNEDTVDQYLSLVSVEHEDICQAYYMTIIKDVTVKPSPLWLQMRLMKMGIRPINNIVDITNYMLLFYGQPLHAFDYDTLQSKTIGVRYAKDNETLVTLDEKERHLASSDVVITANDRPVALAGVMGGLDTQITTKTKTVALETALFNAKLVRETSKRLNLRSESSVRFEKGIHAHLLQDVSAIASALIAQVSEGVVVSNVCLYDKRQLKNKTVTVTLRHINQALGTQLTFEQVFDILVNRLKFNIHIQNEQVDVLNGTALDKIAKDDTFTVIIPPRRFDINIAADIVEEVARIYGYDNLPSTLPTTQSISGGLSKEQAFLRQTRHVLQENGYTQTIGYSLTSKEKAGLLSMEDNEGIALAMPMSEERSHLRRSLLTTLLDIASYNVARNCTNLALYETGRIFLSDVTNKQGKEMEHVALLLTGNRTEKTWYSKSEAVDFFDIKGALDNYFDKMGLSCVISYKKAEKDNLHPGQTAVILLNGKEIGFIAQLHPTLAKQYDLSNVYVAEFSVTPLVNTVLKPLIQTTVPKYPSMTRDMALLVDKTINHDTILSLIRQQGGEYLSQIDLFDYYVGDGIEHGKKSLAYRLTFLNLQATLVEDDVNTAMQQIEVVLKEQIHAIIR